VKTEPCFRCVMGRKGLRNWRCVITWQALPTHRVNRNYQSNKTYSGGASFKRVTFIFGICSLQLLQSNIFSFLSLQSDYICRAEALFLGTRRGVGLTAVSAALWQFAPRYLLLYSSFSDHCQVQTRPSVKTTRQSFSHYCRRLTRDSNRKPTDCTSLQVRRSLVRFRMESLKFFIDLVLPVALWPWVRLSL
jgi:hypothetical protein